MSKAAIYKRKVLSINLGWVLIALILVIEFAIDLGRKGDFIGYVQAGQLVLDGVDIYSDYLNTWPPLFSIFSVPLSLLNSWSPLITRALWLAGSLLAFIYVVRISVNLLSGRHLTLTSGPGKLSFREPMVLVPVLLSLRYIMDNMANIQINIYLLLLCLLAIREFSRGKNWSAALLIALGISLKIYPVFLFLYFLYKREFRLVLWTILFVIVLNSISLMVFGIEEGWHYYLSWQQDVTPRSFMANHKNQSLFGVALRLFTDMNPDHGLYTNIMRLDPKKVKAFTYLAIAVLAVLPTYLFRKRIAHNNPLGLVLEYSFLLTAIPLLSPIAWKAYFIFLWPGIFITYALLFQTPSTLKLVRLKILKILFWVSMILCVGTADIFLGPHLSDVMEAYSLISIGTVLLLLLQLYLQHHADSFAAHNLNLFLENKDGASRET